MNIEYRLESRRLDKTVENCSQRRAADLTRVGVVSGNADVCRNRLPRFRQRQVGLRLVAFAAAVAGSGAVIDAQTENRPSTANTFSVNTITVELAASYEQLRTHFGLVRARRAGDLGFTRAGRVSRVLVDEGDQVTAGDPLAELDARRLEQKQQSLQAARGRFPDEESRAPPQSPEELRQAAGRLRNELQQLEADIQRLTAAAPNGSLTNRLSAAQRQMQSLQLATRQAGGGDSSTAVAELDAELADLALEIEECLLKAPYDGVVALRHVSEGAVVAAGMPVVRLVEQGNLEVWVALPAEVARELQADQTYLTEVGEQSFAATRTASLPELDRTTRTRSVIFSLEGSAVTQVSPGEIAKLQLRQRVESRGAWLPISALTRETRGLWSVFAVDADSAGIECVTRRYVEVLHVEGKRAWVRGTLTAGDRVIAEGLHRVVPGQQVVAREVSPLTEHLPAPIGRGPLR